MKEDVLVSISLSFFLRSSRMFHLEPLLDKPQLQKHIKNAMQVVV